ncbi:Flp pilus assembly protein CpaB [Lentibacillus salinarum]|uniref:Flp pilus assembly protein CpaB n=1 Tax=Lentibacillus salinarum TaxID=446820 RepID=A0ABW3ZXG0_9BACI
MVCGVILAVVIGFIANNTVSQAMSEKTIVVAKDNIEPFTQVTPDNLTEVNRPAAGVPENAATSIQAVAGNFTTTTIIQGNAIQKEHLALEGNGDLSTVLTNFNQPNIRAFALPTQNPMIQDIFPGNRVDLHAVFEENDGQSSVLIADSVLVLGIAEGSDGPVGLTLALSQKQIEDITPVMNNIQISLVPHNADTSKGNTTDDDEQAENETEGGDDTGDDNSDENEESNGD